MARISQDTVDRIKDAADILDVVGEYVALQPAGKNHKGLCPFHNEKTPSFFVSPERNWFHCYGCGAKGDPITFIQKYKNISYVDSLKYLGEKYNIEMKWEGDIETSVSRDRLYQINEEAMRFYQLYLTNTEKGKVPLAYLSKRGIGIHTVQYFEIGYAPKESDALYQHLKEKYTELDMLELGLIKKKDTGEYYDLFRDRVVFPLKNAYGKVLGFSGRLYEAKEDEPKYVNSPFTDIFIKGETLYNLDKAQTFIRQSGEAILYEGFMDVIASVKAGVKNAVASMGTQLTMQQAALLRKYTDKVVICYDGDEAGFNATGKAITILRDERFEISVVVLPEGLDPDDFVRKHSAKAFAEFIDKNKIDIYEFAYLHFLHGHDLSKASEAEAFKLKVFDFLQKKASITVTDIYLKKMASTIGVDESSIKADYESYLMMQAIKKSLVTRKTHNQFSTVTHRYVKAEEILINYYLKSAVFRKEIRDNLTDLFAKEKGNVEIIGCAIDIADTSDKDDITAEVFAQIPESRHELFHRKLLDPGYEYSSQELSDCIMTIKDRKVEEMVAELEDEKNSITYENKKERYIELVNQIAELKRSQGKDKKWIKKK
ncbi:MAG TPA: DNA primase [Bacillota bacterium]|nr:DNA primase [Bacillota bacterium]HPF42756.1 DNA primase [Bacillota bacterium]HPJ85972.1 DNA primase [Bacillota bacterium]HPQ62007.1 DNA primase [Bacillota bacterium]HRX91749.1 DNA primase [Candidatus Izemoplasmatales bacterium]